MSVIIQYLFFCDWFILLSIMSSSFIHIVACNRISFVCIYHILFVPLSINGYLGWLVIMSGASLNVNVKISIWDLAFSIYLEWYCCLVWYSSIFNFLKKHLIVFHSSTILLFHQQCIRISISLYSHQFFFLICF